MFLYKVLTKFAGKKDPLENLYYSFHWNIFNPIRFMQILFEMHQQFVDIEFATNPDEERNLDKARKFYEQHIKKMPDNELEKLHKYLCRPEVNQLRQTLSTLIVEDAVPNEKMNPVFATQNLLEATINHVESALRQYKINLPKTQKDAIEIEPKIKKINTDAVLVIADKITAKELKLFTPAEKEKIYGIPPLKTWVEMSYRRLQKRPAGIKLIDQEIKRYWDIHNIHQSHFKGIPGSSAMSQLFDTLKRGRKAEEIPEITLDETAKSSALESLDKAISFLRQKLEGIRTIIFDKGLQNHTEQALGLVINQLEDIARKLQENGDVKLLTLKDFEFALAQIEVNLFQDNLNNLNKYTVDWLYNNDNSSRRAAVKELKKGIEKELGNIIEKAHANQNNQLSFRK